MPVNDDDTDIVATCMEHLARGLSATKIVNEYFGQVLRGERTKKDMSYAYTFRALIQAGLNELQDVIAELTLRAYVLGLLGYAPADVKEALQTISLEEIQ